MPGGAAAANTAAGNAATGDAGAAAASNADGGKAATGNAGAAGSSPSADGGDPLVSGLRDSDQSTPPGFCERPAAGQDQVRDLFCASKRPEIRSLQELQVALSLVPATASTDSTNYPLLLGHSTALFGHFVSPLNPRAIVLGADVAIAFQRGTQHVELISGTQDLSQAHFYLLSFEQACASQPGGCVPGDLYTPRVERDWTSVAIHDDEQLKNTPADCRQCHQRGTDTPRLLMREIGRPWTHFFDAPPAQVSPQPGVRGSDLLQDYLLAKGDEQYAGIAGSTYQPSFAFILEQQAGIAQPLVFDAPTIERERYPRQSDRSFPASPLPSPTWNEAYEAFKRGEQLALPYVEPRVSDPAKSAQLTAAYQRFRKGELAAEALPDMADIFPDDRHTRALIGLQTEPDATPAEALIQACGGCHNDQLDQTLSRARFNIDLSRMSRAQLDLAIARIELPQTAVGAMPPSQFRQLDPDVRTRLLAFLRDGVRGGEVDPLLQRAAQLGMQRPRMTQ